ncbi:serine hydrolase [Rhizobium sp. BK251]|uniref:serine hydrolase n=1 Tax=Rhizobium sp. BK251 TaxID=2512125 RepID=UPI001044A190|nr:serine hydrolase [Rhizobium sp. BK251]TCL67180.1 uncharacterized protein DUF302 [Rhizobium sp. BK251]
MTHFKRSFVAAVSLALLTYSVHAETPTGASGYPVSRGEYPVQSHGITVDRLIADFARKNNLPGISVAIVQAPYIPLSAGYGRTNIDNDELASTKTMWNIGPITQGFTAVAIMQLKEAGKLALDDSISRYLPDAPPAWADITIRQLMQHASGIPDYRNAGYESAKHYSPSQLLDLVRSRPLLFKSGTDVQVSATNFILLGQIIERASGVSYHDFIEQNQIEPLHLESTMMASDFAKKAFLDRPQPTPGFNQHVKFHSMIPYINPVEPATGYLSNGSGLKAVDPANSENLYAYGGLWSSAEDISAWDIALAGSVLVKDEGDRDLIYRPTRLADGRIVRAMAGWEFTHHPGFMEIKGNSPGFSSYLSRFTAADELVCVTLLTNKEGVDLTDLARSIADAYKSGLGPDTDPAKTVAQESKYNVAETVARIKANLALQKVPVFATFDHGANAKEANLSLRPTQVIVFGNPKVGSKLMQQQQAIGIDLPLRILVWQDERERVWIGYQNMDDLAKTYDIEDKTTIDAMAKFIDALVSTSANVYAR